MRGEGQRPRVLVFDRDLESLGFAAEALHSFRPGFDVATATNLEQARSWLRVFEPDLLLLGVEPAGETLEQLYGGTDALPPSCRVVLCQAQGDVPGALPDTEVLSKPLKLNDLLSTVKRLV